MGLPLHAYANETFKSQSVLLQSVLLPTLHAKALLPITPLIIYFFLIFALNLASFMLASSNVFTQFHTNLRRPDLSEATVSRFSGTILSAFIMVFVTSLKLFLDVFPLQGPQ